MPSLISPGVDEDLRTGCGDGLLVEVAFRSERGSCHGQVGVVASQVLRLVGRELRRDRHQLVRSHRKQDLRGGVARRRDAVDLRGHFHRASGRVGERARLVLRRLIGLRGAVGALGCVLRRSLRASVQRERQSQT